MTHAPAGPVPFADLGLRASDTAALARILRHRAGLVVVVSRADGSADDALAVLAREAGAARRAGLLRDREHAREAVGAALAGELVLAALQAPRAHDVPAVLATAGIRPQLLATVLRMAIAQRRIPALCPHCAQPDDSAAARHALAPAANSWWAGQPLMPRRAGACGRCDGRGTHGMALAGELLQCDPAVRSLIEQGATAGELEATLGAGGTLWDSGLRLLAQGVVGLDALCEAVAEPA